MTGNNRSHDDQRIAKAQLFKGLGHPARVRIVEVLCYGEHSVADLLKIVRLTPPSLSRQLAVLRDVGVVERRRHHDRVVYRLTHPKAAELLSVARTLIQDLDRDERQKNGPE